MSRPGQYTSRAGVQHFALDSDLQDQAHALRSFSLPHSAHATGHLPADFHNHGLQSAFPCCHQCTAARLPPTTVYRNYHGIVPPPSIHAPPHLRFLSLGPVDYE